MIESRLLSSQRTGGLDSGEYRQHLLKRRELMLAVYRTMIEMNVEILAYPSIRRQAMPLGEEQPGSNCMLSANSGLPALSTPAGFTAEGLPVGLELLGREWDEPRLLEVAYAFEQATQHRRSPASTPGL